MTTEQAANRYWVRIALTLFDDRINETGRCDEDHLRRDLLSWYGDEITEPDARAAAAGAFEQLKRRELPDAAADADTLDRLHAAVMAQHPASGENG